MHFERFKVHSRAQSASTNRTGFGVFLWCSSCLGQSTGEMPARHLSLSLSLILVPSLPPSLSLSLSLSASRGLSGTSYDTVVQARHDRFLLMPSRPVGRTRTRRVSGSPSQVLSHKHSTSPCKYMLDIKVRSECKRGRYWTEQARDCERLIRCETRCTFTSISHGTAKQLVQCKSPRARRRAGGIAIPNGKCRGSGILRLSSAEAALPIPDSG